MPNMIQIGGSFVSYSSIVSLTFGPDNAYAIVTDWTGKTRETADPTTIANLLAWAAS